MSDVPPVPPPLPSTAASPSRPHCPRHRRRPVWLPPSSPPSPPMVFAWRRRPPPRSPLAGRYALRAPPSPPARPGGGRGVQAGPPPPSPEPRHCFPPCLTPLLHSPPSSFRLFSPPPPSCLPPRLSPSRGRGRTARDSGVGAGTAPMVCRLVPALGAARGAVRQTRLCRSVPPAPPPPARRLCAAFAAAPAGPPPTPTATPRSRLDGGCGRWGCAAAAARGAAACSAG